MFNSTNYEYLLEYEGATYGFETEGIRDLVEVIINVIYVQKIKQPKWKEVWLQFLEKKKRKFAFFEESFIEEIIESFNFSYLFGNKQTWESFVLNTIEVSYFEKITGLVVLNEGFGAESFTIQQTFFNWLKPWKTEALKHLTMLKREAETLQGDLEAKNMTIIELERKQIEIVDEFQKKASELEKKLFETEAQLGISKNEYNLLLDSIRSVFKDDLELLMSHIDLKPKISALKLIILYLEKESNQDKMFDLFEIFSSNNFSSFKRDLGLDENKKQLILYLTNFLSLLEAGEKQIEEIKKENFEDGNQTNFEKTLTKVKIYLNILANWVSTVLPHADFFEKLTKHEEGLYNIMEREIRLKLDETDRLLLQLNEKSNLLEEERKEKEQLMIQKTQQEAELRELLDKNQKQASELSLSEQKYSDLLKTKGSELLKLNTVLETTNDKIRRMGGEIEGFNKEINEKKSIILSLEITVDTLRQNVTQQRERMEEELRLSEDVILEKSRLISSMEEQIRQLENVKTGQEANFSRLRNEYTENLQNFNQQLLSVQKEKDLIEKEKKNNEERLTLIIREKETITDRLRRDFEGQLVQKDSSLEEIVRGMEALKREFEEKLNSVNREKERIELNAVDKINANVLENQQNLQNQMEILRRQEATFTQEITNLKTSLEWAESKNNQLKNAKDELEQQNKSNITRINTYKKLVDENREKYYARKEELTEEMHRMRMESFHNVEQSTIFKEALEKETEKIKILTDNLKNAKEYFNKVEVEKEQLKEAYFEGERGKQQLLLEKDALLRENGDLKLKLSNLMEESAKTQEEWTNEYNKKISSLSTNIEHQSSILAAQKAVEANHVDKIKFLVEEVKKKDEDYKVFQQTLIAEYQSKINMSDMAIKEFKEKMEQQLSQSNRKLDIAGSYIKEFLDSVHKKLGGGDTFPPELTLQQALGALTSTIDRLLEEKLEFNEKNVRFQTIIADKEKKIIELWGEKVEASKKMEQFIALEQVRTNPTTENFEKAREIIEEKKEEEEEEEEEKDREMIPPRVKKTRDLTPNTIKIQKTRNELIKAQQEKAQAEDAFEQKLKTLAVNSAEVAENAKKIEETQLFSSLTSQGEVERLRNELAEKNRILELERVKVLEQQKKTYQLESKVRTLVDMRQRFEKQPTKRAEVVSRGRAFSKIQERDEFEEIPNRSILFRGGGGRSTTPIKSARRPVREIGRPVKEIGNVF